MTTIAYHKATLTLAADSQSFRGDVRTGIKTKIVRLNDGSVVGATGNWAVLAPWVEHLNGKSEKPSDAGSSIIHMTAERLRVYEEGGWHDVDEPFAAFGSGYQVAMTAMHCGWGAIEAVGMAVKLDPWSGGPVCFMRIEQKQETAAKDWQSGDTLSNCPWHPAWNADGVAGDRARREFRTAVAKNFPGVPFMVCRVGDEMRATVVD